MNRTPTGHPQGPHPGWMRRVVRLTGPLVLGGLAALPAAARTDAALPTLSFWGKVVLVASLIGVGMIAMRRSSRGGGQDPGGRP